jgi:hypothetical protein
LICSRRIRDWILKRLDEKDEENVNANQAGIARNSSPINKPRRYTEDSYDSTSYRISEEGIDTKSIVSKSPSSLLESDLEGVRTGTTLDSIIDSVTNPMNTRSSQSTSFKSAVRESEADDFDDGTKEIGPRSILIPNSRYSFRKSSKQSSSVGDFDQEKFVRFGE